MVNSLGSQTVSICLPNRRSYLRSHRHLENEHLTMMIMRKVDAIVIILSTMNIFYVFYNA